MDTESKSTVQSIIGKPRKPYPSFPLFPHASGQWAKKIKGKIRFFGQWARRRNGQLVTVDHVDDSAAKAKLEFDRQWPYLSQGRTPPVPGSGQGCTIKDLANAFLTAQKRKLESGEITERTFGEYHSITDRLVAQFGKDRRVDDLMAEDFEALRADMAKKWGPVRLGNGVQRVRTVFKYGFESALLQTPVRFGPQFKRPSKSVLRRHRAQIGQRTFESSEIRTMIDAATVPMKAMIYLAINCGFGNGDCGSLTRAAVNLSTGWVNFPRPKTGIARRCPLWRETVEAIRKALEVRPDAKDADDAGLVFITKQGHRWAHTSRSDAVTLETGKLLRKLKLHRPRIGFYSLRHTFRTVADATRDFPAMRLIMGHVDDSIDDQYREWIADERLVAVTGHVRAWLFPRQGKEEAVDRARPTAPIDYPPHLG